MKKENEIIQENYLIESGWVKRPAPTIIGDSYLLDIGRRRKLVLSNINNPNQMLLVCEYDIHNVTKEAIVIHNYDYDKWLSLNRLQLIISIFNHPQ